ncbi:beta-N-acetylglucosaminidase domain-containing protein [Candidatus Tisiphia endosymbiont of Ptychoptera albimana]|uniref:beta-N-acetylglucosaminidase domain-containing protein n=1 Tax=Candidatus Tisiphia endosymbiont of Ptychoptera albimana TaxID=3066260 RepID=UPI00312C97CD
MTNNFLTDRFSYGIIMGYYGPIWSNEALNDYADFCVQYGHKYFIYAPKKDLLLRDNWATPFTDQQIQQLKHLRDNFENRGVKFGIGLSPFGLNSLDDAGKAKLKIKIDQINSINPTILGVFFDDIDKSSIYPGLAVGQVKIAEYIATISTAKSFISVPTYYSNDQILQRALGPTPPTYLSDFSKIDQKFSIFWTGEHIISSGYAEDELNAISNIFKRKVILWDNYPVNDTVYLIDYLRIFALTARPAKLSSWVSGIAFNPMLQAYMSMIPMATAKSLFSSPEYNPRQAYLQVLNELCGAKLAQAIDQNLPYFLWRGIKRTEPVNIERMLDLFELFTEQREQKFTSEIIQLLKHP